MLHSQTIIVFVAGSSLFLEDSKFGEFKLMSQVEA